MKKILIVVTNHATLGETDQPNGTYAPELTHALSEVISAGFEYEIASIQGGKAPLYGTDIEGDLINEKLLADHDFQKHINSTIPVTKVDIEEYDAIFYPGGFGLLSDLSTNKEFAKISAQHYENGGVIAAVCHGPGALLPITLSDGTKLLSTKSITGFAREEEVDFGTINDIPFLLEEYLTRVAASYTKVQPWQEHVIVDGRIITGQNPASAHGVGKALVSALS
ncbi:TPA: type 1 glutamine amidotransferase domain-containing protein [Vibrio alginolyticus]